MKEMVLANDTEMRRLTADYNTTKVEAKKIGELTAYLEETRYDTIDSVAEMYIRHGFKPIYTA